MKVPLARFSERYIIMVAVWWQVTKLSEKLRFVI